MRIRTIGVPRFEVAGISAAESWSAFDCKDATAEQLDVLRRFVGSKLAVHPDDAGELNVHGFDLVDCAIVPIAKQDKIEPEAPKKKAK